MHGIEHCDQERRTLRLSAPRQPFSPVTGSMLPGAPQLLSRRDRMLVTAFPSPATDSGFQRLHSRVKVLACHFASCQPIPLPVRPSAPPPIPVAPVTGGFNASDPLQLPRPARPAAFRPPLPFGTVTSFRIKAFRRTAACQPAFRFRPIPFRSPLPLLLLVRLRINVPGSLLSGGLLFLKPLGTSLTMLPMPRSGQRFLMRNRGFPQFICRLFQRLTDRA